MKYLNGEYYVEVKDKRYQIHPTENIILRKREPPKSLRTQYQVQNQTKIRTNQKVIKNDDNQLIVKNYPRNKSKQPIIQEQEIKLPSINCPQCGRCLWKEIDRGFYCRGCEYIIYKQKHQINKQVHRQDHDFSTRLNYANTKIREIYINMANTIYNTSEDMIDKLQSLKGKTKLKFYKNISDYYKEMKNINFQTNDQDPFSRNAQGIHKIYHEVLLLINFLQRKSQFKNMNINYHDLYHTVIKTRDENKDIDYNYENDENDYIDMRYFMSPQLLYRN